MCAVETAVANETLVDASRDRDQLKVDDDGARLPGGDRDLDQGQSLSHCLLTYSTGASS